MYEPDHPIMTSVTTIGNSYLWQDPGLAAGATRIADWNDDSLFLAVNDNVVALNLLPSDGNGVAGWTGDIPTLYHNAIVWLAGTQWLSVAPTSGTVAPGGSEDVTLTFDTTDLEPGDYYKDIVIDSNDPVTSQVTVPVTLHVAPPNSSLLWTK